MADIRNKLTIDGLTEAKQGLDAAGGSAESLGDSLGPELKAKLGQAGFDQFVAELQAAGVSFDELRGAVDQYGASLVEAAADGEKLDDSASKGKAGVEGLSEGAQKSKNALANMVGNSAQDLGQLGGIAGTAGVALGQLAEGAADTGSLKEALTGAVPAMAALGIATGVLQRGIQNFAKDDERAADIAKYHTDQIKSFIDAIVAGAPPVDAYVQHLKDLGGIQIAIDGSHVLGAATFDLSKIFADAGISAQQYATAVTGTDKAFGAFTAAVQAANIPTSDQKAILLAATQAHTDYATAVEKSKQFNDLFGPSMRGGADDAALLNTALGLVTQSAVDAAAALDAANISVLGGADQVGEFRARMDDLAHSTDGTAVAQAAFDKNVQDVKDHTQAAEQASKAYADTLRDEAAASKTAADAIQARIDAASSAADSFLGVQDAELRLARAKEATDKAYAGGDALTAAAKAEKDALDAVTAAQTKLDAAKAAATKAGDPAATAKAEKAAVDALKDAQDRLTQAKQESAKTESTGDIDLINRAHAEETAAAAAVTAAQQRVDAAKAANNGDPAAAAKAEADAQAALAAAQAKLTTAKAATAAVATGPNSKAAVDAVQDERDAIIAAAKAQLRYAEDQATASGHTLTATQQVDVFNQALEDNARNATPAARQAVYDYIGVLNQIPANKTSTIVADVDKGSLAAANQAITDASQTRTMAIKVQADLDSYKAAIAAAVAEEHHTTVTVDAHAGQGYQLPWMNGGGNGPEIHLTANINGAVSADVNWFAQVFLQAVRQGLIGTGSRVLYS